MVEQTDKPQETEVARSGSHLGELIERTHKPPENQNLKPKDANLAGVLQFLLSPIGAGYLYLKNDRWFIWMGIVVGVGSLPHAPDGAPIGWFGQMFVTVFAVGVFVTSYDCYRLAKKYNLEHNLSSNDAVGKKNQSEELMRKEAPKIVNATQPTGSNNYSPTPLKIKIWQDMSPSTGSNNYSPTSPFAKVIKGRATYWGGHFLYPASEKGDYGEFIVTKDNIIFEKIAFSSKNCWKLEMPLDKVIFDRVSQGTGEDVAYKNKMTAYSYFAGKGPITSYSRNITFLTIPFRDQKGIEQTPRFTFNDKKVLDQLAKFFYEKLPNVSDEVTQNRQEVSSKKTIPKQHTDTSTHNKRN